MHSRWTIGRQAGLRRDTDFMAGKGQDRRFGEKAAALPWLAISVRLAKRQCLAFAPRPAPPAATGVNEKTNLQQKKPSPHVRLKR